MTLGGRGTASNVLTPKITVKEATHVTTHSKRVAAVALSVALGFGGAAAVAGNAFAKSPTPTAPGTPQATTTTTSTPAPTATSTSSPTKTPTVTAVKTEFRDESGADNTQPKYKSLSSSDTTLTSFGSLYTSTGQPLAGQTINVYDYTNGKRGALLGSGTTNAQGQFRFDAKLPSGWSTKPGFNVELAFNGVADKYAPVSVSMKPVSSTATPTKSATPTKKPTTPPTKDTTGGLAKTGA